MMQSIVASLIVLVAFIVVLLHLFTKKKPDNACNSCSSGSCGGCPISEASRNKNQVVDESKKVK
jgi:hypothetical protein